MREQFGTVNRCPGHADDTTPRRGAGALDLPEAEILDDQGGLDVLPIPATFTLVTFHFGDPVWVRHLLSQVARHPDDRIVEIVIVDQSRTSHDLLAALPNVSEVVTFPIDERDHELLGHDHPAAIERVLTRDFSTSHVLIMDSDCFPIADGWLEGLSGACFAGNPAADGLSHPCFNILPVDLLADVDYRLGMDDLGFDTGRLVAFPLAREGMPVQLLEPSQRAFRGTRGTLYHEGRIYHHGSGSFLTAGDRRLTRKVHPATEIAHRTSVLAGRFELTFGQRLMLSVRSRLTW